MNSSRSKLPGSFSEICRDPGIAVYVSLFASVWAFLLWNGGVSKIGPNRAGTFIYLMPFFGAVLSFMVLGEGLQGYQVAGGMLIFIGIALMNWRRSAQGEK